MEQHDIDRLHIQGHSPSHTALHDCPSRYLLVAVQGCAAFLGRAFIAEILERQNASLEGHALINPVSARQTRTI